MMYPILCKVEYETLHRAFRSKQLWLQVAFSIVVNWLIAPFFMVCVASCHPRRRNSTNPTRSLHWLGLSCPMNLASGKGLSS